LIQPKSFTFHHEAHAILLTSVQAAFEHLDDFRKLSAHMDRPSAMMLGSRMEIFTGDSGGRAVGSRVRMSGKVMGMPLSLEEVVVQREPPLRKAWETIDAHLLVIDQYRLGFELEPRGEACHLRVCIDYDWPRRALGRLAAALFARSYARWCTQQMVDDAAKQFGVIDSTH
jgi:hypothetical protein